MVLQTGTNQFCTFLQEFKYSSADTLQSLPSSAILDSYSGGGYVYKIQGSASNIRSNLEDLKRLYWIDNNTRAVILEFSTYNANVRQRFWPLFIYVKSVEPSRSIS